MREKIDAGIRGFILGGVGLGMLLSALFEYFFGYHLIAESLAVILSASLTAWLFVHNVKE